MNLASPIAVSVSTPSGNDRVKAATAAQAPAPDTLARLQEAPNPVDPGRRAVLGSLLAASAASLIPPAFAVPAPDAARAAFLAASKFLTGRSSLDPAQATRLYDALAIDDPQFDTSVQTLVSVVDERKIDPLLLQHVLDSEHSPLAALPRKIVTAWYVGVVGEGERARCITFETNLMNEIVSDKLKPPSYCHGGYGSWTEKP